MHACCSLHACSTHTARLHELHLRKLLLLLGGERLLLLSIA
jgi:hypothetical protein